MTPTVTISIAVDDGNPDPIRTQLSVVPEMAVADLDEFVGMVAYAMRGIFRQLAAEYADGARRRPGPVLPKRHSELPPPVTTDGEPRVYGPAQGHLLVSRIDALRAEWEHAYHRKAAEVHVEPAFGLVLKMMVDSSFVPSDAIPHHLGFVEGADWFDDAEPGSGVTFL